MVNGWFTWIAGLRRNGRCQVVDKMREYYLKYNSNVHRGVHYLSNKCTDANEEARELVREFLHAASDKEVIFTRGTTESINLVAHSFGEAFVKEGDEIVVTEMEHHANIVPWRCCVNGRERS